MENILSAIAFFALIAGQFAAVIAVDWVRPDEKSAKQLDRRPEFKAGPRTRHLWLST